MSNNSSPFKKILSKIHDIGVIGRIMLIVGILLCVLLSFYWDFKLQPFIIREEIYTLDTGTVTFSLAPEFILAIVGIFVFYVGYKLYARKKWGGKARVSSIESQRELIAKFILAVSLGIVGIWYTYSQFSTKGIGDYHIPRVVSVATGSLALQVNAVIALLLLVVLVIEIRIRYEKSSAEG